MKDPLIIDGIVMTDYVVEDGYTLEFNDIDSSKSGRTLDGETHRTVVARKRKLGCAFLPVPQSVSSKILKAVKKKFFTVVYLDAEQGIRTATMYSGTKKITLSRVYKDDSDEPLWKGLSFNLIEK